ncbi:unnamed protein product, partial [marine sediment metagenome]
RWNATTATWTMTEVVSTESTSYSTWSTLAVDGSGNVHIAWCDGTNYSGSETDNDIFYKRWNATTVTWTMTEVVSTESTSSSGYPTLAVDGSGNLHIAWCDGTNYGGSETDNDIFYKKFIYLITEEELPPGIPGYPVELIIISLLIGIGIITILYKSKRIKLAR